jgi:hypothetical protein
MAEHKGPAAIGLGVTGGNPVIATPIYIYIYTSTCFGLASSQSAGGGNVRVKNSQGVRVARFSRMSAGLDSQLRRTTRTVIYTYTLLPPNDGLLASPKHVEVW